jgi:hypothetical protein
VADTPATIDKATREINERADMFQEELAMLRQL